MSDKDEEVEAKTVDKETVAKKPLNKGGALAEIKKGTGKKKLKKKSGKKKGGKKGKGKGKKKKANNDDEKFDPSDLGLGEKKFAKTEEGRAKARKVFAKVVQFSGYQEQAEFFMNAMWAEHFGDNKQKKQRIDVYECIGALEQIALNTGHPSKNKHDLDEWSISQFFEAQEKGDKIVAAQTMTREERLAAFKDIDLDGNKRYSLLEILVWQYKVDLVDLMNKPQGTNAELKKAEKDLKKAMEIIGELEAEMQEKRDFIEAAGKPENAGNKKYSTVKTSKVKAELSQLESKDNLPLNKLLISAEAALRKAKKSKNLFAMGKQWILEHELAEAKNYKPSKNKIKKGRFSVSAQKASRKKKKAKK